MTETEGSFWVRAQYDYHSTDDSSLSFSRGDIVEVLTRLESGWWDGLIGSERGWFPSNFVVVIDEHEAEAELALRAPMDVDPATLDASDSEWVQDELEATIASDDLWLPEVQANGQIVYVNTAGQRRTELPDTDDMVPIQPTRPRANTATTQSSLGGFAFVRRTGTPEPWLKRLTDDGHTFYYENTETGEIVWTRPEATQGPSTQQSLASSASGLDLRTQFRAASPESDSSEVLPANRLSVYSDASEVNPRFEPDVPLDTEPHTDPTLVQRCFQVETESIDQLAQVARQAIAAVGHCMQQDRPEPHAPLVAHIIIAVRNLLYISGTLAPAPAVVAPLAPSTDPTPDPPQALVELKQFQRKVTATLSKLVLSARAADSGEDDVNARSRVVIDASELERAVDRFVHEAAERGLVDSQCEGAKHRGVLDPSRVGRGAPGGGLGGRWRGNGFGERAARALTLEISEELTVLGKGLDQALSSVEDSVRAHNSGDLKNSEVKTSELDAQTIVTRGRAAIAALCALLNAAEEVDVASKVGRDIESRRGMVRRAVLAGQSKRDQLRHTSSKDQLRHASSRDQLRHATSRDQLRHANSRDQLRHASSRDELRNTTRPLGLSRPASRDKLSRMGSRDELGPHALGMSRQPSRDQLPRQTSRDHIPHQPSRDQLLRQTSRDHIPHQPSRDHLPRQSSRDQLSRPGSRGGLSRPASRDRLSRPGSSHRSPRGVGLPASPALRQDTDSTLRPGLSASPNLGLPASPKPASLKIGLSLDTSQDVRLAVRRLEVAKQALYDAGVTLLLASQTVHVVVLRSAGSVPPPDQSRLDADALTLVSSSLAAIRRSSREMLDIYDALARADPAEAYVPVPSPGTNTRSVRSHPVESAYVDDPLATLYGGDGMFNDAFGFESIGRDSRMDSMTTRDTRADSVTTWDTRVESVTTRDTRESRLDSFTRDARADSVTRDNRLDSTTRDTRLDSLTRDARLDSTESARGTYSRAYPERGIYSDADRGRQDDRFYDKSRAGPHLDSAVSLPQSDVSAESNGGFYSRSGTALGKSRPEDDLDSSGDEFDKPAAHRPSKLEKLLGPEANEVLRSGGTVTPAPIIDSTPWYLKPTYNDPSQIMTNTDGGVRGGTLPALVERLTMHDQLDATFIDSFLMTYKSFTDIKELFQLLVQRFRIEPPDGLAPHELEEWKDKKQKPAQVRVVNIFRKMLLDSAVIDKEDNDILEQIKKFAAEIVTDVPPARQLIVFVDRIQTQGDTLGRKFTTTLPASLPPSILPKPGKRLKLIDIDPLELARQLTLMESKLYNAIKPIECLARARDEPAENDSIKTIITTTNKIASWVAFSVLDKEDPRRRSLVLKHFIQVAEKCRALHNYSSMAALIAGLNSPPIRRLKRSWDAVPSKFTLILDDVETTLDSNKNFTTYKQRLKSIVDPCVPFLGVYLTMLTFIQDGNKDFISKENGIINFGKRQKTAEVIREIQGYQSRQYQLAPVDQIQTFIEQQLSSVEEKPDYWDKSLSMEPREREDEKMTRMLQESGFL